jgi:tRNA G18 (ribose-2'-O)-methylase SpoU
MRGYFAVGVWHVKSEVNIGTLWRSAYQLGAAYIFTIGKRYKKQSSDTHKAWRHIPLNHYETWDEFIKMQPYDAVIVGIEMGGIPLARFTHPERAIYVLGAEDYGLDTMLDKCQKVVSLEAVQDDCYNVAVAGSLVMYHRNYLGEFIIGG